MGDTGTGVQGRRTWWGAKGRSPQWGPGAKPLVGGVLGNWDIFHALTAILGTESSRINMKKPEYVVYNYKIPYRRASKQQRYLAMHTTEHDAQNT